MLNRFAILTAVCMVGALGAAPLASAEPDAGPPPPDTGVVESGPPGTATTPDGRNLTVSATNETQVPVAPLTTSLASREYLVGGTFSGSTSRGDGGTLEAGYQIGCGVGLDRVEVVGSVGVTPAIALTGLSASVQVSGQVNPNLAPGTVTTVSVTKKKFKGTAPRVIVSGFRVKVDGCVGQSFVRSYAKLTSSNGSSDDIVNYTGVTKAI